MLPCSCLCIPHFPIQDVAFSVVLHIKLQSLIGRRFVKTISQSNGWKGILRQYLYK